MSTSIFFNAFFNICDFKNQNKLNSKIKTNKKTNKITAILNVTLTFFNLFHV